MQIIPFHPDDRVIMKKKHPCGGNLFRIVRVGSEVRVICETCKRDMTIDRVKLDKAIQRLLPSESDSSTMRKENENGK